MGRWFVACASAAWLAVSVAGCGGPTFVVQPYAGPPRPSDTIAVIRVNGGGPSLAVVDGEALRVEPEQGTRLHIEVMPGVHEVAVVAPALGVNDGIFVRFPAEAGRVYRMVLR